MHVKFSKSVAIDINQVDRKQWGKLIRVSPVIPPSFVEATADKPEQVIEATVGAPEWHVRLGVAIDLPQDLAEAFIDAGAAELVTDPPVVKWVADVAEMDKAFT